MTWRRRRRALWRLQPRPTADASPTLALNQTRWRPPHPQPQPSVTSAGTDSAGGCTTLCLIAAPGYAPPSLLEKVSSRSMPPTKASNHGIQTARGRPRRIARGGENPGAATASICPRAARRARAQQPRAVGTPPLDPRQQLRSQLPPGGIGCLDPRDWCHRLQAWRGGAGASTPATATAAAAAAAAAADAGITEADGVAVHLVGRGIGNGPVGRGSAAADHGGGGGGSSSDNRGATRSRTLRIVLLLAAAAAVAAAATFAPVAAGAESAAALARRGGISPHDGRARLPTGPHPDGDESSHGWEKNGLLQCHVIVSLN